MALRVDICKKLNHFTLKTQFEASEGVTGILGASGCGKEYDTPVHCRNRKAG